MDIENAPRSALIILPPGVEEEDFAKIVGVLRIAGILVTVARLDENAPVQVHCSPMEPIVATTLVQDEIERNYDAVVLPNGNKAAEAMGAARQLGTLLMRQQLANRMIAAFAEAPLVLLSHRIGVGKMVTATQSLAQTLTKSYEFIEDKLTVMDKHLLTSRHTTFIFAVHLAERLDSQMGADAMLKAMLLGVSHAGTWNEAEQELDRD